MYPRPRTIFRIANYGMAITMGIAAALQVNDPDTLPWLAYYLAASACCLQTGRWSRDWLPPAITGLIGLAWAIHLSPAAVAIGPGDVLRSMNEKGGAVELAREVGGLGLSTLWMTALVIQCLIFREDSKPTSET